MGGRIDYAEARRWTNYITLDPLALVQNILGGGDVQRDRLAIADLEIQAADLVRRREEVAEGLAREVVGRVLAYERLDRELELLASQLETQQLQQVVMESAYRTGQGDTGTMLQVWQRTEDLEAQCHEQQLESVQTLRELELLVGELGGVMVVDEQTCASPRPVPLVQPVPLCGGVRCGVVPSAQAPELEGASDGRAPL